MSSVLGVPSFYAHVINGLFVLVSIVILVLYYSKIIRMGPYFGVILTLLFSICIGVHGISHSLLEAQYGYNPLLLGSFKVIE
jgi:hypothetical protein